MYKDGYVRIGGDTETFGAEISLDEAHELRNTVVNELFIPYQAKANDLEIESTNKGPCLGYTLSRGVKTRLVPDADSIFQPSIFIGAHLRQFTEDRWNLTITRTRMNRVDNGMSEQRLRTIFKIICWGDMVEANRTVKFVKATPLAIVFRTGLDDESMSSVPYYKRVGFTTPVLPEDCEAIGQLITRHVSRTGYER